MIISRLCLAYIRKKLAMVKMIGRHSLKPGEQFTKMMSDMLLYEADIGVLRAMMNTEYITTLCIGASAAHSAFLFAKSNFKTVGLIGLGHIISACVDMFIKRTKDRPLTCKALQAS